MGKLTLLVLIDRPFFESLGSASVSYQTAQFFHLQQHADVIWKNSPEIAGCHSSSELRRVLGRTVDAIIVFDELFLLTDPVVLNFRNDTNALFVFITHDWWCHPLKVAGVLSMQQRALVVLRHESARQVFRMLHPNLEIVVQRPG